MAIRAIEQVEAQDHAAALGLSSEFHEWDMNRLPHETFLPLIYTKRASIDKEKDTDTDRAKELKKFADELIKYVHDHIVL